MSYVTRGVELVPCEDATAECGSVSWRVDVRDCSGLSSRRRSLASSALPAPSSYPPGPAAPDPPRPSASVRLSFNRPSRVCHAHASLSTHPGPIHTRSIATRELRPTVLPPASLYVDSFTLQLYTHRHRDRRLRHTPTRSPRRDATRIGRRSHRDHTASYSKWAPPPDAFRPEPHDFSKLAGLRSTDSPVSSSLIVKRAFFASYAVASPHVPLSSGRPCSPYMRRRLPNFDM